ncbi:MAG: DEAD/DEAH box helicase [Hyphococcus sp.]|nr:MAG: DEAD/DEAH box helicase [Marinicaulis sp.]
MIEELSNRIWAHEIFHQDASALRESHLRNRYATNVEKTAIDDAVLSKLLRSAAILSASQNTDYRETAYHIVTAASELVHEYPGIPYVLLLSLSRMGNFPAVNYAKNKYSISENSLPTQIVAEGDARRVGNTVTFGKSGVALTDFQWELWKELNTGEAVGVSAPTSAGKSFILQAYARKQLVEKNAKNVVFLVPTRALINQVSDDIAEWLSNDEIASELITTPVPKDTELPESGVYTITQERLQLLHMAHPSLVFDLMVVDEAQSIGDGPRGVLLSSVIEEALLRNKKMQLLFAGPNIKEPGRLAKLFEKEPKSVRTDETTVVQNIVFIDCDSTRPKRANLSFSSEAKKVPLGPIDCDQPLIDHKSKLINLALRLGQSGQNLLYAMGPAECEKIAFGLSDFEVDDVSDELIELSKFIEEAVHPKYQLAQTVLKKVGFHYGRLPSLVRKAIEDAFSEGELQYLVTTSTLLYGVNMPAQNLFLHNPQKGQNQPISAIDFWNLAGRAGRLGKEFSGNIFLIDYGDWPTDPMSGDKDQDVTPSIEVHVVDQLEALIAYINDPEFIPDRQTTDTFENTFVKLVRDLFDGKLKETLKKLGLQPDDPRAVKLVEAVKKSTENTDIDLETLTSSPTVTIHRQQSLYEWLERSLKKGGPSYIIPKHPLDPKAYMSYLTAIKRCHGAIMKYPKSDKSHSYYAQIAIKWMRGQPLPQIIDASYDYKVKQGQNPNIATVIRETLNEVERDLRFKYVRLFSCYNAVLELVLRNNKLDELIPSVPSIPMYLEVGACSPTMISFMGLGLSRYTAGKLQSVPRRTDMSQAEARNWIKRQRLDTLDLPSASINEIRRLVG